MNNYLSSHVSDFRLLISSVVDGKWYTKFCHHYFVKSTNNRQTSGFQHLVHLSESKSRISDGLMPVSLFSSHSIGIIRIRRIILNDCIFIHLCIRAREAIFRLATLDIAVANVLDACCRYAIIVAILSAVADSLILVASLVRHMSFYVALYKELLSKWGTLRLKFV